MERLERVPENLSVDRIALRAFVFVLILSLKKSGEKPNGFGALGCLKYNLVVKTVIRCLRKSPFGLELLYFEFLTSHRKVTNVSYKFLPPEASCRNNST